MKFEVPLIPNFVRGKSKKQNWLVPITELTLEEIRQLGKKWTEAMIKKAKTKSKV